MVDFNIGLNGLTAAQKGLEIVGNNIANAATEGYHRRRADLTPSYTSVTDDRQFGGGVEVAGVRRMVDSLLENEILNQTSYLEKLDLEYNTLGNIENALGELYSEEGGLNASMDTFFNAVEELTLHPDESIWQNQLLTSAEALAGQFRTLGSYLTEQENQLKLEADNNVNKVNSLINQIADFNDQIEKLERGGKSANSLKDRRDLCIKQLSEYISVETVERDFGVVDVSVSGISVVIGTSVNELKVGLNANDEFGFTVKGDDHYDPKVEGGRLGAFFDIINNKIADIREKLDTLASTVINKVNDIHVQGIGSAGSFTQLTGQVLETQDLSEIEPPVESGGFFITIKNTSSGEVSRHDIFINPSTKTVSDIVNEIDSLTGVNAKFESNRINISSASGYEFNFLPGVLPEPTDVSGMTSPVPDIEVGGIYEGDSNRNIDCTVMGSGEIGVTEDLKIKVEIGGKTKIVNVGQGYAAGEPLDIGEGLTVSISDGTLNDGDIFKIKALADSDTSGFLSSVGLNTFFSGTGASDMKVCERIKDQPSLIATARSSIPGDNTNAHRISEVQNQAFSELNDMEMGNYYRKVVNDLGQEIEVRGIKKDSAEVIMKNLINQQGEVSGVDVNDEAARMLIFEQMFQGMSKYLQTLQNSMDTLMQIV